MKIHDYTNAWQSRSSSTIFRTNNDKNFYSVIRVRKPNLTHSCAKASLFSDDKKRWRVISCKHLISKFFFSLRIFYFLRYIIFNFGPSQLRGSCSGQKLGKWGVSRNTVTRMVSHGWRRMFNSEINCPHAIDWEIK